MYSMAAFRLYYVLKRWKVNNPLRLDKHGNVRNILKADLAHLCCKNTSQYYRLSFFLFV